MPPAGAHVPLGIVFDRADKRYGNLFALRQFSAEIAPGEFVALLGPNGAGKTTLLRMAALLSKPSSGEMRFTGAGGSTEEIKQRIGMVAHSTFLYDDLTARENLEFFGRLYSVKGLAARVSSSLESAGLAERSSSLVRTFSRGMKQRLSIARALLASPSLLLLDEPSTGLDRAGVAWLAETLSRLKTDGCTALMSTHVRGEFLGLVTRALSLAKGRLEEDSGPNGNPAALLAARTAEN